MTAELIVGFILADLALILSPGPDWIYVLTRGIAQGRQIAIWSVVGVCLGYLVHTVLVVAGLAALVTASPGAFRALRAAGALYVAYLGIRMLLARNNVFTAEGGSTDRSRFAALAQGAWTSGLNPKGLLLYFAVLPQFVDVNSSVSPTVQLGVLGLLHVLGCGLVYGLLAVGSGTIGSRLQTNPRSARRLQLGAGVVLTALGGKLLLDAR